MKYISRKKLINALRGVIYYSISKDILLEIKNGLLNEEGEYYKYMYNENDISWFIYSLLVLLFGEYDFFPCDGKLKVSSKKDIIKFIDKLLTTYKKQTPFRETL